MRLDDDGDSAIACRELALRCKPGFISYPVTTLALLLLSPALRQSPWPSATVLGIFCLLLLVRARLCQDILDARGSVSSKIRTIFDLLTVLSAVFWSIYIGYIGLVGEYQTVCIALLSSIGLGAGAVTSLAVDYRLFLGYFMGLTSPALIVLWTFESPYFAFYASAYLSLAVVVLLVNRIMYRTFWGQILTEREHLKEMQELRRNFEEAEKLRTLGVLSGGVAHDFNNFLTSFVGNIDLALLDIEATSPARECLEEAKQLALNASELCEQLLAYAGKTEARMEKFSLNDLILQTNHLLQTSIGQNLELQLYLDANAPDVLGDPAQIRQVLLNLSLNAAESMPHKTGIVRVATAVVNEAETSPSHPDPKPRPYLCLSVTDEGYGMSPEVVEKIYDPFFTTKFTGRGLGLASVHGIVRGHHGKIKVMSTPDLGTTFQVFLPIPETIEPTNTDEQSTRPEALEPSDHSGGDLKSFARENFARREPTNWSVSMTAMG